MSPSGGKVDMQIAKILKKLFGGIPKVQKKKEVIMIISYPLEQ